MGEHLSFKTSLAAAICYFLVGILWSLSTFRLGFDLGWLLIALLVSRGVSARMEHGTVKTKDWLIMSWPAIPGFILEWLSDASLHDFRGQGRTGDLVRFAIFSSLLLVFVTFVTGVSRFGIEIKEFHGEEYSTLRRLTLSAALATAALSILGTVIIFGLSESGSTTQLAALQSWLYMSSLVVYLLLTLKMFPSIAMSIRETLTRKY